MRQIEFRPLTVDDYALAEQFKRGTVLAAMGDERLFEVWFPAERPYSVLLARAQAFDPASCVFIEVDGVAVGGVHLFVRENADGGRDGHVNNIFLLPEWRGKGLGEKLDGYAMAFFRRHGVTWAGLRTNPLQPKVVAFYQRMGWRLMGEAEEGMVWMGRDVE